MSEDEPDTVFVAELWESAEAHRASLSLPSVQAAIAEARPLLSGVDERHCGSTWSARRCVRTTPAVRSAARAARVLDAGLVDERGAHLDDAHVVAAASSAVT